MRKREREKIKFFFTFFCWIKELIFWSVSRIGKKDTKYILGGVFISFLFFSFFLVLLFTVQSRALPPKKKTPQPKKNKLNKNMYKRRQLFTFFSNHISQERNINTSGRGFSSKQRVDSVCSSLVIVHS